MDVAEKPGTKLRQWLQFNLRHVGIVITLVAVGIAYYRSSFSMTAHPTGRELDVAIFGRGYFQVGDQFDNDIYYTRVGRLYVNATGQLAIGPSYSDWIVKPPINVPMGLTSIRFGKTGQVSCITPGHTLDVSIGQLELATFVNDDGLRAVTPGVFAATNDSGQGCLLPPGMQDAGMLQQRWLESPGWPGSIDVTTILLAGLFVITAILLLEIRSLRRGLHEMAAKMKEPRQMV